MNCPRKSIPSSPSTVEGGGNSSEMATGRRSTVACPTVICVGATASRDAQGTHSLRRWLVNHAMKASKFIGSVNVKESSDEC